MSPPGEVESRPQPRPRRGKPLELPNVLLVLQLLLLLLHVLLLLRRLGAALRGRASVEPRPGGALSPPSRSPPPRPRGGAEEEKGVSPFARCVAALQGDDQALYDRGPLGARGSRDRRTRARRCSCMIGRLWRDDADRSAMDLEPRRSRDPWPPVRRAQWPTGTAHAGPTPVPRSWSPDWALPPLKSSPKTPPRTPRSPRARCRPPPRRPP